MLKYLIALILSFISWQSCSAQWLEAQINEPLVWIDAPVDDGCAYSVWGRLYRATNSDSAGLSLVSSEGIIEIPDSPWYSVQVKTYFRPHTAPNLFSCNNDWGWRDEFKLVPLIFVAGEWVESGEWGLILSETDYHDDEHWIEEPGVPGPLQPGEYSFTIWADEIQAWGVIGAFDLSTLSNIQFVQVFRDNLSIRIVAGDEILVGNFIQDGEINLEDLYAFLTAWFAGDPRAGSCDGVPGCQTGDIFEFLGWWFEGIN